MKAPHNRLIPHDRLASGPSYCTVGDMLCELRVWTEQEWAALPEGRKPVKVEHVAGLGWVGAIPAGRLD